MGRVYVSSTFRDLVAERQMVHTAIRRLGHHAIGMEDYGASERKPLDKCLEDIRSCHAYVGLFAWRYGFTPEGSTQSITELEYEEAGKEGIERLCYLSPERENWKGREIDPDTTNIARFRERVSNERLRGTFVTPDDVRFNVAADLRLHLGDADVPPALLPYLCDRHEQLRSLNDVLSRRSEGGFEHPVLCIIHGVETQAHAQFTEVMKYHHLPSVLDNENDVPVSELQLRWPRSSNADAFRAELTEHIAQELCRNPKASRELVEARLAQSPGPVLITAHFPTEEWDPKHAELLRSFVQFWRDWPRELRRHPRLVILFVPYRLEAEGLLGWWRRARVKRRNDEIKEMIESLGNDRTVIFPPLDDVRRSDVDDWARRPEVKTVFGARDVSPEIRKLFDKRETFPMEELATSLEQILMMRARRGP